MTYDLMKIDDSQFLDILSVAKEHGALTMVHAENSGIIKWISDRLVAAGHTQPRYHAISHPAAAEAEAINRAITLARFVDAALLIVHVSTPEGAGLVAQARLEGAKIFGETCPQYLFLTRDDLDRPGMEGAKFMCSPPVRDASTQEALWRHLQAGTFSVFSSDHAPYRFDETGKLSAGPEATFKQIANGMPGLALRLPLLFSEGVNKGRITLNQFVALSATNAARLYGITGKGTIAIGADADIAIWDPDQTRTVRVEDQHDAMDYTPVRGAGAHRLARHGPLPRRARGRWRRAGRQSPAAAASSSAPAPTSPDIPARRRWSLTPTGTSAPGSRHDRADPRHQPELQPGRDRRARRRAGAVPPRRRPGDRVPDPGGGSLRRREPARQRQRDPAAGAARPVAARRRGLRHRLLLRSRT